SACAALSGRLEAICCKYLSRASSDDARAACNGTISRAAVATMPTRLMEPRLMSPRTFTSKGQAEASQRRRDVGRRIGFLLDDDGALHHQRGDCADGRELRREQRAHDAQRQLADDEL